MPEQTQRSGGGIGATHSQPATRRWVVSITPRPLYPGEITGTNCSGGWVGLRAVLDGTENLAFAGIRSPDRPALRSCYTDCAVLAAYMLRVHTINVFNHCHFLSSAERLSDDTNVSFRYVELELATLYPQATKNFIDEVNRLRRRRRAGPVSWTTAVKFLAARKFEVIRAVALYEQHEAIRHREGLVRFDPSREPLKSELDTGKFTILVSTVEWCDKVRTASQM